MFSPRAHSLLMATIHHLLRLQPALFIANDRQLTEDAATATIAFYAAAETDVLLFENDVYLLCRYVRVDAYEAFEHSSTVTTSLLLCNNQLGKVTALTSTVFSGSIAIYVYFLWMRCGIYGLMH